jgi:hypothetical protein
MAEAGDFRHHFSARTQRRLNLFRGGSTYHYLGHCITRGLSLRRHANIFRLGGVVRFQATRRCGFAAFAAGRRHATKRAST